MIGLSIEGYGDRYTVYEDGSIFDIKRQQYLKAGLGSHGYLNVTLQCVPGGVKPNTKKGTAKGGVLVHRVVAETFLVKPEHSQIVNHKNGNKTDNRLENLEWCSYQENNHHARVSGLMPRHKHKTYIGEDRK